MARDKKPQPLSDEIPTEVILESISDGVFTIGEDWRIRSFNRAAEEITGISRKEALGKLCAEVFRSNMCEASCALRQTLETGRPVICKAGYIVDADGERIPVSISTAVLRDSEGNYIGGVETFRDLSEVEALRRELEGRTQVGDLVSRSPSMQKIFDVLPAIASSPSTVLVLGETGTGKELVARAIHDLSERKDGPFVAVNCGALPDTLLESELFGYKAGAFTDARRDKPGRFAMARGGTLFLDEIGEVSPALQVRLLRVLQEGTFEPLGATREEKTDARIIVATNRDLKAMMREGDFREDLYYRVNIVRIELPPLRDRKEDIPLLIEHFIDRFNRLQEKSVTGIENQALGVLLAHDWPGNVRELENVIERCFILCGDGPITVEDLPEDYVQTRQRGSGAGDMKRARDRAEADTIRRTLEKHDGNRAATARALGIHKSTLFRKMKRFKIS